LQPVAFFDLDYTLLDVDSEELWCDFLAGHGWVDSAFVRKINEYYEAYQSGEMDFLVFEEYLLQPIAKIPAETLMALQKKYLLRLDAHVSQTMMSKVEWHRTQGHQLLLITASNGFLAQPIGERLGFQNIISTEVERVNGAITGRIIGTPAFREGKPKRLESWMAERGLSFAGSWGYSDSHNDLPLLELVEHPVAVRPNATLESYAREHKWQIIRDL
jgi:HAD superfamily hydrolase (TIGR01490 family)